MRPSINRLNWAPSATGEPETCPNPRSEKVLAAFEPRRVHPRPNCRTYPPSRECVIAKGSSLRAVRRTMETMKIGLSAIAASLAVFAWTSPSQAHSTSECTREVYLTCIHRGGSHIDCQNSANAYCMGHQHGGGNGIEPASDSFTSSPRPSALKKKFWRSQRSVRQMKRREPQRRHR